MSRLELGQIFDRSHDDDGAGHGSGGFAPRHGGPGKPIPPSVIAPELSLAPAYQPLQGLLLGDQGSNKVFHLRDLNGDGDTADAGERLVFFDATNASGLGSPAGNVFAIHQADDGTV